MPKFLLLDHAVCGVGQHHFEYGVDLLRAAERQGWQPVLGAHRELGDHAELAPSWEIYRAFQIDDDDFKFVLSFHHAVRKLAAAEQAGGSFAFARRWRYRVRQRRYQRRYERLQERYGRGLDEIWSACRPTDGDQVFVATVRPLDIAALARWACKNRSARDVDWHLQFHFPLVDAETWYTHPTRQYGHVLTDVPEMLQELLGALDRSRVHLYATTESLAAQLCHCLGERFAGLPYPVNTTLAALRAKVSTRSPLRATCTGQPRAEKGSKHWSQIVSDLTTDYFATGRLQLALQTNSQADLPEPLRRLAAELSAPIDGQPARTPVALAGWPLSPPDYLDYLASSSIGLLMYDPVIYHVRCSGVLVEMLSAGIPIVAPAGCWLADQIAEPIYAHQEQLRERLPVLANLSAAQLDWKMAVRNSATGGMMVGVDAPGSAFPAAVAQAVVPAHATHLLVLLARDEANGWNHYCSVTVEQRDAEGKSRERSRDIIGYRGPGRWMTVLVPLSSQSRQIEIRLQTAFGSEPFLLSGVECCFLAASDSSQPAIGAVGRLISDPAQAAECLRDVVDHYDHYEKSALAFAATWAPTHTADQVLRDLTRRAAQPLAGRGEVA